MRTSVCLWVILCRAACAAAFATTYDIFLNNPATVTDRSNLYGNLDNALFPSTPFISPGIVG